MLDWLGFYILPLFGLQLFPMAANILSGPAGGDGILRSSDGTAYILLRDGTSFILRVE